MTIETLRVSEPRDLLSMVPFQLGFTPTDSLVLVSLRGRRRLGLVLRTDLPAPDDPRTPGAVRELVEHLLADGAGAVLAVLYSAHRRPAADPTLRSLLTEVTGRLADASLDLLDAWHVGPTHYRSLVCEDPCCPSQGWPVATLASSPIAAAMVYRGLTAATDRAGVTADLAPAAAPRRLLVDREVARCRPPAPGEAGALSRWRRRVLRAWRAEVARVSTGTAPPEGPGAGTRPSGAAPGTPADVAVGSPAGPAAPDAIAPGTAALLLSGLRDVAVRDAVMVSCVAEAGDAPDELVRSGRATPAVSAVLERVFSVTDPVRPHGPLPGAATDVLKALTRLADGPSAAPPLALLTWIAWWQGDGARARDYVDRALAADPEHGLAGLLDGCLSHGVPPGWARRDRDQDLAAT